MKRLTCIMLLITAAWLLSGCAITHEYGPYMGKVVEKGTGMPIEGAVVFMRFYTEYPTPGGPNSVFIDALEVLTDKRGEFVVPSHKLWTFRPIHKWDHYAPVIIFKPGYGAYPGHRDTGPDFDHGAIPQNKHVTIILPKLKSKEERKRNLGNLWAGSGVPQEKYKILNKLETRERIEIGLKP